MKITIGLTCYNHQDYIEDAIQSALDQSVPCEIIVVNDGSTDHSGEVIDSFKEKGIKVIHQVNKGLPSARNTLIMAMTGDYLLSLDSDDMLQDNCVEEILKVIEATGADIVAPSFKCFGGSQDEIILIPNPTLEDFKIANRIGYCSAIKREALIQVGGYSPRMYWGYEDFHLWFSLLTRGKKIVTIPEKLWLYRVKENSMITESIKHHDELIAQIVKDFPQVWK